MVKFRTKYERVKVCSPTGKKSLTDQQYKDDCSIEGIIKRYGVLPPPEVKPIQVDCSGIGDFAEAMQKVIDAREQFADLPADVRRRFGDNPEALFAFLADSNNEAEAIRLGLVVPRDSSLSVEEYLKQTVDVSVEKYMERLAENANKVTPKGGNPA